MRNTINTNPKEDTMDRTTEINNAILSNETRARLAALDARSLAQFDDDPEGALEDLCAEFATVHNVDPETVYDLALSLGPVVDQPGCVSNPIVRS
jgi:hypothetical protein